MNPSDYKYAFFSAISEFSKVLKDFIFNHFKSNCASHISFVNEYLSVLDKMLYDFYQSFIDNTVLNLHDPLNYSGKSMVNLIEARHELKSKFSSHPNFKSLMSLHSLLNDANNSSKYNEDISKFSDEFIIKLNTYINTDNISNIDKQILVENFIMSSEMSSLMDNPSDNMNLRSTLLHDSYITIDRLYTSIVQPYTINN